jgi:carbon-monoxide dehydrogenase large subunit
VVLAKERVCYQGKPVAVVLAEDRPLARQAAEAVDVGYERLEAVTDPYEAVSGDAPVVHDEAP